MHKFVISPVEFLLLFPVTAQNDQALSLKISAGVQGIALLRFSHIGQGLCPSRIVRLLQDSQQPALSVYDGDTLHGAVGHITSSRFVAAPSRQYDIVLRQDFPLPQGGGQIQHSLNVAPAVRLRPEIPNFPGTLGIPLLKKQKNPAPGYVHAGHQRLFFPISLQEGIYFLPPLRIGIRPQEPLLHDGFSASRVHGYPEKGMLRLFLPFRHQIFQNIVAGILQGAVIINIVRRGRIRQRHLQAIGHTPGNAFRFRPLRSPFYSQQITGCRLFPQRDRLRNLLRGRGGLRPPASGQKYQ